MSGGRTLVLDKGVARVWIQKCIDGVEREGGIRIERMGRGFDKVTTTAGRGVTTTAGQGLTTTAGRGVATAATGGGPPLVPGGG